LRGEAARCIKVAVENGSGGFSIGHARFGRRALAAGLHLVATPIGNLGDVTIRALETLASADLIACEDTRVTKRLLARYAIDTRTTAYHEHNADRAGPKLIERLRDGARIALVSDAGTPLVSDPGFRLVEAARAQGIAVIPVPGPSAPLAALTASGLPAETFLFDGFLPPKQGARRARLMALAGGPSTLLFFEAPTRLAASLADIAAVLGLREVAVCRELTKIHEEIRRGTANELADHYGSGTVKGEVVIIIAPPGPAQAASEADAGAILSELLATHSPSRAAAAAAELTGLPKRDLYARALGLAGRRGAKP